MNPVNLETLSVRLANVLHHNGLDTWEKVAALTEADFLRFKNCGQRTLAEAMVELDKRGLRFAGTPGFVLNVKVKQPGTAELMRRARCIVAKRLAPFVEEMRLEAQQDVPGVDLWLRRLLKQLS